MFPVAHVAVGVGLTYYTLAGFLNHTLVLVANGFLRIRHGLLPWPGNHALRANQLGQLFTQADTHRSRSGTTVSHSVCAILEDGRKIVLLSGLPDVQQGLFVEQSVEQHLRIKDAPIPGEVAR